MIVLKDGREALLRSPVPEEDAPQLMNFLNTSITETDFLLRVPEEAVPSVEIETKFLRAVVDSQNEMMITCDIGGALAGNCSITFNNKAKTRHRATVGIALLQKYWNLGIGTAMFEELISIGRRHGLHQLELEFIEGNDRGLALYQKMGFEVVGFVPDAIRQPDGRLVREYKMVLKL